METKAKTTGVANQAPNPVQPTYQSRTIWGAIAVLILVTIIAYGRVKDCDFVNYDDGGYVKEHYRIHKGLTWENFVWSLKSVEAANWHPLTWLSHMLDCDLFGVDPGSHHIVNLTFHLANSALLFLTFLLMLPAANISSGSSSKKGKQDSAFFGSSSTAFWMSFFIAALFAVHPMNVQSVAWISERKNVLSTLFWILTMWAYAKYVLTSRKSWYVWACVFLGVGLTAKPMLVTVPCALLLLDYWPLRRIEFGSGMEWLQRAKTLFIEKIPMFLLVFASCAITYFAQDEGGAVRSTDELPLSVRLANTPVAYLIYIWKMFWPTNLSIYYPHPGVNLPGWKVAGAVLILCAITAYCLLKFRQQKFLISGWLWFLGTMIPVIGIVQVGSQALADRYAYVPYIGLFFAVLPWIYQRMGAAGAKSASIALGAATLALTAVTWVEVGYWKNSFTLFTRALHSTKDNDVAYNNLGAELMDRGEIEQAMKYFQEGIRIQPTNPGANGNMGKALMDLGRLDEAIKHFKIAIDGDPKSAEAQNNMGSMLLRLGKNEEALDYINKALQLNPDFAKALNNLGMYYLERKNYAEAEKQIQKCLSLNPKISEALNNMGSVLLEQGRHQEALEYFQKAINESPKLSEAYSNVGLAHSKQKNHQEALQWFQKAISINSSNAMAYYRMGMTYKDTGQIQNSVEALSKSIQINPKHAEAHNNLGTILLDHGKTDEALKCFNKAIEHNPKYAEAKSNKGIVFFMTGDLEGAKAYFLEAIQTDPKYPDAHNNLATVLAQQRQFDSAFIHFQRALELQPNYQQARLHYALALTDNGKLNEAADQYRELLRQNPSHRLALENLQTLEVKIRNAK